MLQKLGDHIRNCLERAAEAKRHADETADSTLKPVHLLLERSWIRLARSYEFVESLERFLLTADNPTRAAIWQWRILEAHSSLAYADAREELGGQSTVSLVRHGPYEVRLIELPRESENETEQLWLELFDHHHKQSIDRYRGRNLKDTAAAAELLFSKAKFFSQST